MLAHARDTVWWLLLPLVAAASGHDAAAKAPAVLTGAIRWVRAKGVEVDAMIRRELVVRAVASLFLTLTRFALSFRMHGSGRPPRHTRGSSDARPRTR